MAIYKHSVPTSMHDPENERHEYVADALHEGGWSAQRAVHTSVVLAFLLIALWYLGALEKGLTIFGQ
jgi:hypothetical protein